MATTNVDSLDFAASLLDALTTALGDQCSDTVDEDVQALKRFAASPELAEARHAATRLREAGLDKHPFVNRIIESTLEELGL